MVWSPAQRVRLAIEKEKLEKYFRLGVFWIDPENETKVEVLLKSNSDREFKLRIYIPSDFPNSCPLLVVVSPEKLYMKNGQRLPETSDAFHTLEDVDNFHRICHFHPPSWTADITLFQVFMKGRIWIEAYEAHLATGKKMDEFLTEHTRRTSVDDEDDEVNGNLSDGNQTCQNSNSSPPAATSSVNNQPRPPILPRPLILPRQPSAPSRRYVPRGGISIFQPAINEEMVRRASLSQVRRNNTPDDPKL